MQDFSSKLRYNERKLSFSRFLGLTMPGRRISSESHAQIAILFEEGKSTREITAILEIPQATVSRSVRNFKKTGKYGFRKPEGRRKITSSRMDKTIIRAAKKSPQKSSEGIRDELPKQGEVPSARTIRRRLSAAGLKSYRPAKKPRLSSKNIKDRLAFCKKYRNWTEEQWARVMFSDETQIVQFGTSSGCYIRRPPNQRHNPRYVSPTVKNSPKIMIWGAISACGRCGLWFMPPGTSINGNVYLQVLEEKVPNFMTMRECTHFQHDGAPCHQTKAVKEWFGNHAIEILGPWPGNSPDLNPIENCWFQLKKKVSERRPSSLQQLREAIKDVWVSEITPEYCRKLCSSMPHRISAVLKNKGLHTKY